MGYRAYGYGVFTLKGESKIKNIVDALDAFDDYDYDIRLNPTDEKGFVLEYNTSYSFNYHEEDVRSILDAIKDFVAEGSRLTLTGEDDDHWAFTLLGGEWVEESGRIVYGISPDVEARLNGGHLIADKEMAKFLLDVLDFAGSKYEYDVERVDDDEKEVYANKAGLCSKLWYKIYAEYLKASK
jgi:hypothetical protein